MTDTRTTPQLLNGLSEIADRYDAALVDIWGVMHNGVRPFDDAVKACQAFRQERGPVVLVSNSPRPSQGVRKQLRDIGVPDDAYDGVVTSGDSTREELAKRAPGPAYAISPDKDAHIYDGLGLEFADLENAAFASVTGLFNDANETPDDYADILHAMRERNMEMVCANPDVIVEVGDRIIYCAGALAEAYAGLGGRVVMAGKPFAPIYDLALTTLGKSAGRAIATSRIVAIGDGPRTDLRGANGRGIDAVFVVSGMHGVDRRSLTVELAAQLAAKDGAHAEFAMKALAW